jgi:hypothetical protein
VVRGGYGRTVDRFEADGSTGSRRWLGMIHTWFSIVRHWHNAIGRPSL